MIRLLYALVLGAMAAGTARSAENALADLASAASPAALENAAVPSPAPALEPAATPLNEATIQGEYLVRIARMPELRIILSGGEATLIKADPAGDLVCKGTYKLDAGKKQLLNDFTDCGGSTLSHTMELGGQTVESLTAGAKVLSSLLMDGDITPGVPVKIQKVK